MHIERYREEIEQEHLPSQMQYHRPTSSYANHQRQHHNQTANRTGAAALVGYRHERAITPTAQSNSKQNRGGGSRGIQTRTSNNTNSTIKQNNGGKWTYGQNSPETGHPTTPLVNNAHLLDLRHSKGDGPNVTTCIIDSRTPQSLHPYLFGSLRLLAPLGDSQYLPS